MSKETKGHYIYVKHVSRPGMARILVKNKPTPPQSKEKQWNCRFGINGWHEKDCPHQKEQGDKLGDAFSKFLEDNGAKVVDCTPTETPQQGDWEKDFDEKFGLPEDLSWTCSKKFWEFGEVCKHDDYYACEKRLAIIKSFISAQIQQAREEERARIFGGKIEKEARDSFEDYVRAETLEEVEQIMRDTLSADTLKSHKEINKLYLRLSKMLAM